MGSTFYSIRHHIIFSTKHRQPSIHADWRTALHEYLGGTIRGLGGVPEAVGGIADHVHLLVSLRTIDAPTNIVRELKKASSVWATAQHEPLFAWQEGYAIFSVSSTHVPTVRRYIERQEEHHRATSFLDEARRLLEKNGVRYEERYLL